MINKVVVNNFKKFGHLEFELTDHLVIAGPNNSGKTTLLQAIASWSEFAFQWSTNNPDLVREKDGNYPSVSLNLLRFHSVPLADFNHLWQSKNIQQPASLWLYTEQWKIGFEVLYKEQELADIRPAKNVDENDLEQYIKEPLISIYVPPLSGIDITEAPYESVVIPARLAQARAGSILRNLLLAISQDTQKWQTLQEVIHSFFGYELLTPSGGTAEIFAGYRHSEEDTFYNLNSAASGFLQVLLVYAALLHKEASVVLIDEPDAHLHILLQKKMYYNLKEYARQNGSQLIISTHSEQLINVAHKDNLRLLAGELRKVNKRKIPDTLYLENMEIMLANTEPGILYIEGPTDIPILREWARVLKHPLLSFLEKPFERETAQQKGAVEKHFSAMRLIVPDLRGAELQDGDKTDNRKIPEGMIRLRWNRYEIESYLIYPEVISRFVESIGGRQAADKAETYMDKQLHHILQEDKPKNVLAKILKAAGVYVRDTDYYQIAAQMTKEEISSEVIEKLDAIAEHFSIGLTTPPPAME